MINGNEMLLENVTVVTVGESTAISLYLENNWSLLFYGMMLNRLFTCCVFSRRRRHRCPGAFETFTCLWKLSSNVFPLATNRHKELCNKRSIHTFSFKS